MPIDKIALARARPEFEALLARRFPDLPESDELGDCVLDLLLLDPQVAAKVISALNGNLVTDDYDDMEKTLQKLSTLKARLMLISANPSDVNLVDDFRDYIEALLRAGGLIMESRIS